MAHQGPLQDVREHHSEDLAKTGHFDLPEYDMKSVVHRASSSYCRKFRPVPPSKGTIAVELADSRSPTVA